MNNQEKRRFAEIVIKLRGKRKIRDFAKTVGVSHPTILGWEDCRNEPNVKNLEKIAELRGETLDELLNAISNTQKSTSDNRVITVIRQASKEELSILLSEISKRIQNI